MSFSVMAAEHRVCDQKHEKQKRHSDGDEKLCGRCREAFSGDDCGCTFWEGQREKKYALTQ